MARLMSLDFGLFVTEEDSFAMCFDMQDLEPFPVLDDAHTGCTISEIDLEPFPVLDSARTGCSSSSRKRPRTTISQNYGDTSGHVSSKPKRSSSVSWGVTEIHEVRRLKDLPADHRQDLWITRGELKSFRRDIVKNVEFILAHPENTALEEHGLCFRGIERVFGYGQEVRAQTKAQASNSVFEEQWHQRQYGIVDPEAIASRYIEVSQIATSNALKLASFPI